MNFTAGEIYHIYNRGNNAQVIFFSNDNYLFFLRKIRKELNPYCEVLAYCLMPNHFHLMVCVKSSDDSASSDDYNRKLNQGIAILLRSYTRAIQKQENFKGSLFQQKSKAVELNNNTGYGLNHPAICLHYIHQNPLKASIVRKMEDWEFSSFKDYAGLRAGTLCNKQLGFSLTGIQRENFIKESYEAMIDIEER
jgi:putative transposase